MSQAATAKSSPVSRGRSLFADGFPGTGGNGRTCSTCHVPDEQFQLTPANVEARYTKLQQKRLHDPTADDPLFRSIDANDGASDYTNLRTHALIRVVIKLPTNAAGEKLMWPVDDPNATEVSVWRSVPSVQNVAMTAPYQLDGRAPTLQIQALGALHGHSQITSEPTSGQLDDVSAFQKKVFSSPSVEALSDAIASNQPLPSTDGPLTELEQQGKALFDHHCTGCHGGPSQTVPDSFLNPAIHDAFISKPVPPFAGGLPFADSPVPPRLWQFKDGPTIPSTDPGEALLTGSPDQFNHFDVPSLYGMSKTAPYFHDNSVTTLNGVVLHYQSLFTAIQRVIPPDVPFPFRPDSINDADFAPLVAYLSKL